MHIHLDVILITTPNDSVLLYAKGQRDRIIRYFGEMYF